MPVRDDDLTRALRDVAPAVDASGAYEHVIGKRTQRRTVRRARFGALALVTALVVMGGAVLLTRDGTPTRVSTPATSPTPKGWVPVKLGADEGYLRGPLTVSQVGDRGLVSMAVYDRDSKGGFTFPPSRIVRFDPRTLEIVDRVDLKAEILSVVEGFNGTRYGVTRNPEPAGPPTAGLFFKVIAPDGSVASTPLPPGIEVTGALVLSGRWVYLPTRGAVLAFELDGRIADFALPALPDPLPLGIELPRGFTQKDATTAGERLAVAGVRAGTPTVVLVDGYGIAPHVRDIVAFPGGRDVSFAWVADDTVLATSGGELLRHRVG